MRTRNRQRGFTLVELLVATTLTIFIMLILTSAFRAGLDAFRLLRASGQLQEKLRSATAILRRDLTAEHFGVSTTSTDGPYLRDQRLDLLGWQPPTQGFFRIQQNVESATNPFTSEGVDADGIASSRSSGHILHFTARLNQIRQADYFIARFQNAGSGTRLSESMGIPGYSDTASGIFASEWAEVVYFLAPVPNAKPTSGPSGLPTFALCRKQRLVTHPGTTSTGTPAVDSANSPEISCPVSSNNVNSVSTLTSPHNRMDCDPTATVTVPGSPPTTTYAAGAYQGNGTTGTRPRTFAEASSASSASAGNDILLTNVLSFEVKAIYNALPANGMIHTPSDTSLGAPTGTNTDTDFPFAFLPTNVLNYTPAPASNTSNPILTNGSRRVFDTWSRDVAPAGIDWNSAAVPPPSPPLNVLTSSGQQVPLRIRVQQLQIRIRIWDTKAEQTRQITIVQDV